MMSDSKQEKLYQLQQRLKEFAVVRDWEQFHSPKNLSTALMVEAAELAEHFQWLTEEQSHNLEEKKHKEVSHEMADIFIYLLRMCEQLDVDIYQVVEEKILINEKKYPAEKVRGSSKKYNEY